MMPTIPARTKPHVRPSFCLLLPHDAQDELVAYYKEHPDEDPNRAQTSAPKKAKVEEKSPQ